MSKANRFVVIIQGATLESDLSLNIPSEEYSFWLFKPGRALLYLETMLEHDRRFFQKAYRGHSVIIQKGFTIQTARSGPQAVSYLRKMLSEGDWECSDLVAKRRFEEAIGELE